MALTKVIDSPTNPCVFLGVKIQTLFSVLFILFCVLFFAFQYFKSPEQTTLYISTSLTGTLRKGVKIHHAIELFNEIRAKQPLKIVAKDSQSNGAVSARQTSDFLRAPEPKLIFSPPGSNESDLFVARLDKEQWIRTKLFFLNQIVASRRIHEFIPTLTTFFSSKDYFTQAVDLISSVGPIPRKAHLFIQAGAPYLEEVAEYLRKDLSSHKIPIGLDTKIDNTSNDKSFTDWKNQHPSVNDWIFIISFNDSPLMSAFKDDFIFSKATKIITYGSEESDYSKTPWYFNNSWQLFFWTRYIRFENNRDFDNCEFVSKFTEKFHMVPDFHAAFIFSTLEAISEFGYRNPFQEKEAITNKIVSTITGSAEWDSKGFRKGNLPLWVHFDGKQDSLYLPTKINGLCDRANERYKNIYTYQFKEGKIQLNHRNLDETGRFR